MKNIIIFDTTLRDGEQSPGASMTTEEKIQIALMLEKLKVDIIEAGFAFASKADFDALTEISRLIKDSTICSLARATEQDIKAAHESIKHAKRKRIHTFIATSDLHLKYKLQKSQDEVLQLIKSSVSCARNLCDDVEWSAEDATRTDINYLIKCTEVAIKSGAKTINLPDTLGFTTALEYKSMFEAVIKNTSSDGIVFSTHCHNDLGMATANALAGICGGAGQIECTINGIGERAGNTAMEEIVMTLKTRSDLKFKTDIETENIKDASKLVQKITGFTIQPNKAIVGKNAFLHESGIHQDGILKNRSTYEIIDPREVGIVVNPIVLGRLSGRSALKDKLKEFGCKPSDVELNKMFEDFKSLASTKKFILDNDIIDIINQSTGKKISKLVEFKSYSILNAMQNKKEVGVKLLYQGSEIYSESDGSGVMDAIFKAINKGLDVFPVLENYSLDAVSSGTDAVAVASIILTQGNQSFAVNEADGDITIASAKAYVSGINKIMNSSNIDII